MDRALWGPTAEGLRFPGRPLSLACTPMLPGLALAGWCRAHVFADNAGRVQPTNLKRAAVAPAGAVMTVMAAYWQRLIRGSCWHTLFSPGKAQHLQMPACIPIAGQHPGAEKVAPVWHSRSLAACMYGSQVVSCKSNTDSAAMVLHDPSHFKHFVAAGARLCPMLVQALAKDAPALPWLPGPCPQLRPLCGVLAAWQLLLQLP